MLSFTLAHVALGQTVREVPSVYPTVAEAVSDAEEDDIIRIDAAGGPYLENLTVDISLLFEGTNGRPLLQSNHPDDGFLKLTSPLITVELRGVELDGLGTSRVLRLAAGALILQDVLVHDTNNPVSGGAIHVEANDTNALSIYNSIFETSATNGDGAFVAVLAGDLTIQNSTFATANGAINGGMISTLGGGDLEIRDSQFQTATAGERGGLIDARNTGALKVIGSEFLGVEPRRGGGGAIYIEGPTGIEVSDNTFRDNQALGDEGGGAIYNRAGHLELYRNVFCNNMAADQGGAVRLHDGTADVQNNLFIQNDATNEGGALYVGGTASFVHNSASGDTSAGGAIVHGKGPVVVWDSYFADSSTGPAVLSQKAGDVTTAYSLYWNNAEDWTRGQESSTATSR